MVVVGGVLAPEYVARADRMLKEEAIPTRSQRVTVLPSIRLSCELPMSLGVPLRGGYSPIGGAIGVLAVVVVAFDAA